MKLLVLGGTVFVGRHVVEAALAKGHDVTLFNRGRDNPGLFPEAEKLRGDRDADLSALRGRRFDAVIDPSAYRPAQVRAVVEALGNIGHYTFVSSISVYKEFPPGRRYDETSPVAAGDEGYGALKARCEETAAQLLPGRAALVRPGLIVGPHDPTDRFTYWPRRVARGGAVLAPGRPELPVQFIDVRDLADWLLVAAEKKLTGTYNAVGPTRTMGGLLEACRRVTGADARFIWAADQELLAAGVAPWTGLPLWIPEADPESGGHSLGENSRAVAAGLVFRGLEDTVKATLDWDRASGGPPASPIRATPLSAEREARLLEGKK